MKSAWALALPPVRYIRRKAAVYRESGVVLMVESSCEQVSELTADDGLVIVIAPWQWKIHRYPVDCWRVLPDGMEALFEWAGLKSLEVGLRENDCYGVARKQQE